MQASTLLFVVLLAYCVTSSRVSALRCYHGMKSAGLLEKVEQVNCNGTCVEAIMELPLPDTGPFPGRKSYNATKPGIVSVVYLSIRYIHCVQEKITPYTMCDRNVKSEYILIKLCAFVLDIYVNKYEIYEKILFDSGVISLQIPMTKYIGFQYSFAYCSQLSLVNS